MPGHETEPASSCRLCAGDAKAGPSTTDDVKLDDVALAAAAHQAAINARGRALIDAALNPRDSADV